MTTIDVVREQEKTLTIETSTLFELLDAPVGPDKGQQMLSIFKNLTSNPQIDPQEAAQECRRASFILDNLTYMDAEDFANERTQYARWFYNGRKKLMNLFSQEARRLDPSLETTR